MEILVGLWLRSLKPKQCRELVRQWRLGVSTPRTSANDNLPEQVEADREYVTDLLDRHCEACPRDCTMKALVQTRARKALRPTTCAPA